MEAAVEHVREGVLAQAFDRFREEKLLSSFQIRLTLEREGLERYLHTFAYRLPTLYGGARSVEAGKGSVPGVSASDLVKTSAQSWAEKPVMPVKEALCWTSRSTR